MDTHGYLTGFPLAQDVVCGVAEAGRIDDLLFDELLGEVHGLDVAIGDAVGIAVGVEETAAVAEHEADQHLRPGGVSGAGARAVRVVAGFLEPASGVQQRVPVGGH